MGLVPAFDQGLGFSWGEEGFSRPVWPVIAVLLLEPCLGVAVPSLGLPGRVKGRAGTGAA